MYTGKQQENGVFICTIPTLLDHLDIDIEGFVSDETFQTFGDIISTSRKCRIWEHNITEQNKMKNKNKRSKISKSHPPITCYINFYFSLLLSH